MIALNFALEGKLDFQDNQKLKELFDFWSSSENILKVKTSGSTGKPQVIALEKQAILSSIQMTQKVFGLNEKDIFLCNLSLESIGGIMVVLRALELKAKLYVQSPSSTPASFFLEQSFEPIKPTVFAFVPLQLEDCLRNLTVLSHAKTILVGGAPLTEELENKLHKTGLPFYATYGMTETISHIALRKIGVKQFYQTLPGVEIRLSEEKRLEVKSPTTSGHWIRTNDIAEIEKDTKHAFKILGRADFVINSGGIKLQLEDIERKLQKATKNKFELVAFGIPDRKLGTMLCCAYRKTSLEFPSKEELKKLLPTFEVPKKYFALEKFPLTLSGKIDRNALKNAYLTHSVSDQ